MPIDPPSQQHNYVIDPESATEMVRLILQNRLVTRYVGGLFPPEVDPATLPAVLDLACGPGGWVLEAAYAFPKMELVGVDISQAMIQYAQEQARSQGLYNARFQVMNALQRLDFEDNTFDFVNARFLTGFMSPSGWPSLLQECKRVLRPGGILRLLESEDFGITNSPAVEQFTQSSIIAGRKLGRAFFAEGRFGGAMAMLGRLLRNADFKDIHRPSFVIDWSSDTEDHSMMAEDIRVVFPLLRPFLLKTGVLSPEQFENLYEQALIEIDTPDFTALMLYMSAWGKADK